MMAGLRVVARSVAHFARPRCSDDAGALGALNVDRPADRGLAVRTAEHNSFRIPTRFADGRGADRTPAGIQNYASTLVAQGDNRGLLWHACTAIMSVDGGG